MLPNMDDQRCSFAKKNEHVSVQVWHIWTPSRFNVANIGHPLAQFPTTKYVIFANYDHSPAYVCQNWTTYRFTFCKHAQPHVQFWQGCTPPCAYFAEIWHHHGPHLSKMYTPHCIFATLVSSPVQFYRNRTQSQFRFATNWHRPVQFWQTWTPDGSILLKSYTWPNHSWLKSTPVWSLLQEFCFFAGPPVCNMWYVPARYRPTRTFDRCKFAKHKHNILVPV